MIASDRQRPFLRFLAHHNPFYLLSAASMLLACLLLSNTMTWSPIAITRLLTLIATLSFYEILIVGLALYLIARRGLVRDGVMLLTLEAFFIADIGFLSSEIYQESLAAGLIVNAFLLVVGVVKLYAIFRVIRLPMNSPLFAMCVVTLVVLLGHPAVLKQLSEHRNGNVAPITMYGMWWLLAALIAGYGVLTRLANPITFRGTRAGIERAGVGHLFMLILLASIIAHIGTAHWVYKSTFEPAHLSPLFIGLAVWVVSLPETNFLPRSSGRALAVVLALIALSTGTSASPALRLDIASMSITPTKCAAVGVYLALVYAFVMRRFLSYAIVGLGATVLYAFAPTWDAITDASSQSARSVRNALSKLLPSSQAAWGGIALVGAFVLLGVGAWLSLFHRDEEQTGASDSSIPPVDPTPPMAM